MNALLAILFWLPIVALGADVRVSMGMAYADATSVLQKNGGLDVTSNVSWLYQQPHEWSFWDLSDHKAVLLLLETDGKITRLSYWSAKDFADKERRMRNEQGIQSFEWDPTHKKLRIKKAPISKVQPNKQVAEKAAILLLLICASPN